MMPPKHILGTFDEALSSLLNNVLMTACLAERSLDRAVKGLLQRDDNLCTTAIADDEEIDQLEKQIDKEGVDVLLRFQPVASDLRRVVAAMKLSPNIERIADQATNIARRARKLNRHPPLPEVEIIVPIQAHAMAMFKDSIDAYVRSMLVHAFLAEQGRSWTRRVRPAAEVVPAPATPLTGAEHRIDLRAALAKLSRGQRTVLVLRYWEDLDVAQTAAALGCSAGTVKSQTSYAIGRTVLPSSSPSKICRVGPLDLDVDPPPRPVLVRRTARSPGVG